MKKEIKKIIKLLNNLDSSENYSNVFLSRKYIKSVIENLEQSVHLINLDEQK